MAKFNRRLARQRRQKRTRKKVIGTAERPRLNVYRSLSHMHAQIIDDFQGHTLVAASTVEPEVKGKMDSTKNREAAKEIGKLLAERAKAKGITKVTYDRGGFLYHGRVASLAEGAREGGLEF